MVLPLALARRGQEASGQRPGIVLGKDFEQNDEGDEEVTIHPTRDWLLVEPVAVQMTSSGLYLDRGKMKKDNEKPTMIFGRVIEAGPGFINENGIPIDVPYVKGDVVAFLPSAMVGISGDVGDDYQLVKLNQVFANIEDFKEFPDDVPMPETGH